MPTNDQRITGLYKRGEIWHIDKKIMGKRIVASTGSKDYEDALRLLFQREREIRDSVNYGLRPKRKFGEAMIKYLKQCQKPIDQLKSDAARRQLLLCTGDNYTCAC